MKQLQVAHNTSASAGKTNTRLKLPKNKQHWQYTMGFISWSPNAQEDEKQVWEKADWWVTDYGDNGDVWFEPLKSLPVF